MSGESPEPECPTCVGMLAGQCWKCGRVTESGEISREISEPERASERRARNVGKLERAYVRRRLIVELAKEEKTQRELAALYDCSVSSVNEFKQRHMPAILEVRENLGNEFAGLWIAQKLDRLSEMVALYEDDTISSRDRETRLAVLRHAAEELGQIPNKTTLDITAEVKVKIEGLDDV